MSPPPPPSLLHLHSHSHSHSYPLLLLLLLLLLLFDHILAAQALIFQNNYPTDYTFQLANSIDRLKHHVTLPLRATHNIEISEPAEGTEFAVVISVSQPHSLFVVVHDRALDSVGASTAVQFGADALFIKRSQYYKKAFEWKKTPGPIWPRVINAQSPARSLVAEWHNLPLYSYVVQGMVFTNSLSQQEINQHLGQDEAQQSGQEHLQYAQHHNLLTNQRQLADQGTYNFQQQQSSLNQQPLPANQYQLASQGPYYFQQQQFSLDQQHLPTVTSSQEQSQQNSQMEQHTHLHPLLQQLYAEQQQQQQQQQQQASLHYLQQQHQQQQQASLHYLQQQEPQEKP